MTERTSKHTSNSMHMLTSHTEILLQLSQRHIAMYHIQAYQLPWFPTGSPMNWNFVLSFPQQGSWNATDKASFHPLADIAHWLTLQPDRSIVKDVIKTFWAGGMGHSLACSQWQQETAGCCSINETAVTFSVTWILQWLHNMEQVVQMIFFFFWGGVRSMHHLRMMETETLWKRMTD